MSDDPEFIPIPEFLRRQVDDGGLRASHRTIERLRRERDEAHGVAVHNTARAEKAEAALSLMREQCTDTENRLTIAEARAERLREALTFYANKQKYVKGSSWGCVDDMPIEADKGAVARAALAEEEGAGGR